MNIGWAGKSGFGGVAVEGGWGLCGFAGLAVGAEGCAVGALKHASRDECIGWVWVRWYSARAMRWGGSPVADANARER